MLFESIPWSWDADQYEEELKLARDRNREHTESMMKQNGAKG